MNQQQQIRYLQIELSKAKAEATLLRKTLKENGKHARRIEKAYEDALLLATWRTAGIIPSRRFARLHNMTQNRWQNAVALLRMARVIVGQRRWATADMTLIESRLEKARIRALEQPEAFWGRLNRHGRR